MSKKKKNTTGGNYEVGYGRPPKSGQIKPGEVRNRWGKTGKPKRPEDLLLKVAAEEVPATVNGKSSAISQEEGAYRRLFQKALEGDASALKLLLEHLSRRRPPLPPVPTWEELQQQAEEQARREELSAKIVGALERMAAMRRRTGAPRMRYGPDGRPIGTYDAAPPPSPGPLDEPVEKPGG